MATAAALSGDYHLSRRKTGRLLELVGVRMSIGTLINIESRVSEAVEPAVDQAWEQAHRAPVKHTDGTSWSQGGKTLSATLCVRTLLATRKSVVSKPLGGVLGVVSSRLRRGTGSRALSSPSCHSLVHRLTALGFPS